jgi:hypothetical protein
MKIDSESFRELIGTAIGYAKFCGRSHNAVIRVYDDVAM